MRIGVEILRLLNASILTRLIESPWRTIYYYSLIGFVNNFVGLIPRKQMTHDHFIHIIDKIADNETENEN